MIKFIKIISSEYDESIIDINSVSHVDHDKLLKLVTVVLKDGRSYTTTCSDEQWSSFNERLLKQSD